MRAVVLYSAQTLVATTIVKISLHGLLQARFGHCVEPERAGSCGVWAELKEIQPWFYLLGDAGVLTTT